MIRGKEKKHGPTYQGVFGVVVVVVVVVGVVVTARVVAVTVMPVLVVVVVTTAFSMTLHQPRSLSRFATPRMRTLLVETQTLAEQQPKTIRLLWPLVVGSRGSASVAPSSGRVV